MHKTTLITPKKAYDYHQFSWLQQIHLKLPKSNPNKKFTIRALKTKSQIQLNSPNRRRALLQSPKSDARIKYGTNALVDSKETAKILLQ